MYATKRGEPLPINAALNKPRTKLGLTLWQWFGVFTVSFIFLLFKCYILAVVIFGAVYGTCTLIIRNHPKQFDLWGHRLTQRNYYDPRKG